MAFLFGGIVNTASSAIVGGGDDDDNKGGLLGGLFPSVAKLLGIDTSTLWIILIGAAAVAGVVLFIMLTK